MKKYLCWIVVAGLIFTIASEGAFAAHRAKVVKVQPKLDPETELYNKAQKELGNQLYMAYRITERLARTNKLDGYSWRVYLPRNGKNLEVNASASDGNLITVLPGIIDSFAEDISASAYVIAHEMAHHKLGHLAKSSKELLKYNNSVKELQDKYKDEAYSSYSEYGALGMFINYGMRYYTMMQNMQKTDEAKSEANGLYLDFLTEVRKDEYEADRAAVIYLIRAGFDPKGAIRAQKYITKLPFLSEEDESTHPPSENRLIQIEDLVKTLDIKTLKREGKINIANSKPLTFERTVNKQCLRINSRAGSIGDVNKPFKDLFGK